MCLIVIRNFNVMYSLLKYKYVERQKSVDVQDQYRSGLVVTQSEYFGGGAGSSSSPLNPGLVWQPSENMSSYFGGWSLVA